MTWIELSALLWAFAASAMSLRSSRNAQTAMNQFEQLKGICDAQGETIRRLTVTLSRVLEEP